MRLDTVPYEGNLWLGHHAVHTHIVRPYLSSWTKYSCTKYKSAKTYQFHCVVNHVMEEQKGSEENKEKEQKKKKKLERKETAEVLTKT